MGWLVLTLVAGLGTFALMASLLPHIRTMWRLAQTFLEPMWAAVKPLVIISLTAVAVLFVIVPGSSAAHTAASSIQVTATEHPSFAAPLPR